MNRNIAKWFEMSMEWLKQIFGDFKADQHYIQVDVDDNSETYGLDSSIRSLIGNEECKHILVSYLPMFADEEMIKPALDISLRLISQYAKDMFTQEILQELECKLNIIKRS